LRARLTAEPNSDLEAANLYKFLALFESSSSHDLDGGALIMTALGLVGESGELSEHVMDAAFFNHPINLAHLKKELGDILWYIGRGANAIDTSLDQIMAMNIAKLLKRYPDGFSSEASLNRAS
jgi:NTP pyrophosphatase (non-canonical NTP hydrolase)